VLLGPSTAIYGRVIRARRRQRTPRGRRLCSAAMSRRGVAGASVIFAGPSVSVRMSTAGHLLTADQRSNQGRTLYLGKG
jgi:hypothetical protein